MDNAYPLHFLVTVIAGWINRYQQAVIESDDGQMSADGLYDSGTCYEAILSRGAVPTIPPRRNAKLSHAKDLPPVRAERLATGITIPFAFIPGPLLFGFNVTWESSFFLYGIIVALMKLFARRKQK